MKTGEAVPEKPNDGTNVGKTQKQGSESPNSKHQKQPSTSSQPNGKPLKIISSQSNDPKVLLRKLEARDKEMTKLQKLLVQKALQCEYLEKLAKRPRINQLVQTNYISVFDRQTQTESAPRSSPSRLSENKSMKSTASEVFNSQKSDQKATEMEKEIQKLREELGELKRKEEK